MSEQLGRVVVQLVAFVELRVRVWLPPAEMVDELGLIEQVGAGFGPAHSAQSFGSFPSASQLVQESSTVAPVAVHEPPTVEQSYSLAFTSSAIQSAGPIEQQLEGQPVVGAARWIWQDPVEEQLSFKQVWPACAEASGASSTNKIPPITINKAKRRTL